MGVDSDTKRRWGSHDTARTVRTALDGSGEVARDIQKRLQARRDELIAAANAEPVSILDEAKAIVEGKARDYGEPSKNATRIARFWGLYLEEKYGLERGTLDAGDVCAMMRLLKEARQIHSFGRDNLTDIAGWAAVQDEATR